MLANLLNVPRSDQDWSIWSLANYDAVQQINDAILAQKKVMLPQYQLEPIPLNDLDTWLSNNQQAHIDITSTLGLQSNDLLHVDLHDANQREAWIWLNFQELLSACQVLKIGP